MDKGQLTRRATLTGLAATSLLLPSVATGSTLGARAKLTIYSPAPPSSALHALNLQLASAAMADGARLEIETRAVALPDSINAIVRLPREERPRHLPIVTTVDFALARRGLGPDWHSYSRASEDLKLVTVLYEVGFGIFSLSPSITSVDDLRGKRIAVPARPSAVRLMTEMLLRDGWDILDDVTLVDMIPGAVGAAFAQGMIEATAWNLVIPTAHGFRPMLPDLLTSAHPRFLAVTPDAVARINAANPVVLGIAGLNGEAHGLLSFAQGLAAWQDTDPELVRLLLEQIRRNGAAHPGLPHSLAAMVRWHGLTRDHVHPVALSFLARHGLGSREWPRTN